MKAEYRSGRKSEVENREQYGKNLFHKNKVKDYPWYVCYKIPYCCYKIRKKINSRSSGVYFGVVNLK